MANRADTTYMISGSRKAVNDLWVAITNLGVNNKDVYLDKLAEFYGIDYKKKMISVRGYIYFADLSEDEEHDRYVLTIDTDTGWNGCHELFHAINEVLWNEMTISYREIETGMDIYNVHDEEGFFPEICCVSSSGEPFDELTGDVYNTVEDAISEWCELTGESRGELTEEEMMDYINEYEYTCDDTYFYINRFCQV